jgi:hypothetical protein
MKSLKILFEAGRCFEYRTPSFDLKIYILLKNLEREGSPVIAVEVAPDSQDTILFTIV